MTPEALLTSALLVPADDEQPAASGPISETEVMAVYRRTDQPILAVKLVGRDRYGWSSVTETLVRERPDLAAEIAVRGCRAAMAALGQPPEGERPR